MQSCLLCIMLDFNHKSLSINYTGSDIVSMTGSMASIPTKDTQILLKLLTQITL